MGLGGSVSEILLDFILVVPIATYWIIKEYGFNHLIIKVIA
jgi:hypothetical protein